MKKRMLRYVVLAMMVALLMGGAFIYYVGRILATKSDITSEIGRR